MSATKTKMQTTNQMINLVSASGQQNLIDTSSPQPKLMTTIKSPNSDLVDDEMLEMERLPRSLH